MRSKERDKSKKRRLSKDAKEFIPKNLLNKNSKPPTRTRKKSTTEELVDLFYNIEERYNYSTDFPRLNHYKDLKLIRDKFPSLSDINKDFLDIAKYQDSSYFIMRSTHQDDIHKAMKYGVWTSTPEHNSKLEQTYTINKQYGRKTLLFFRVIKENTVYGVAELVSSFNRNIQKKFWWNNIKWKGLFNLKWIYVKDLELSGLSLEEYSGKKLYELTDCSEVCEENGFFLM